MFKSLFKKEKSCKHEEIHWRFTEFGMGKIFACFRCGKVIKII